MEPPWSRVEAHREALPKRLAVSAGAGVDVVVSPYRVCPIGAHSDHQGGPVLGIGISAGTLLAFAPAERPEVRVVSEDFEGEARLDLRETLRLAPETPLQSPGWGRYVEAAARVLGPKLPASPRGLVALLHGSLPGGGLSSSASVLLAYLTALARVNGLALGGEELVALARHAENAHVGVASGILDPASIVGAERDRLLVIDTRANTWHAEPLGPGAPAHRILVAYTGVSRNLTGTLFNARVDECRSAARRVAGHEGLAGVSVLGDLPEDVFEAGLPGLPAAERGRATHFLTERRRVREGVAAWRAGALAHFGALMNESCRSSIGSYETGSEDLVALQEILLATPGVLGARFSGAGFGGCSIALVEAGADEEARAHVERAFLAARPALSGKARFFLVDSEDGVRVV